MNSINLVGRLTREPELRTTTSGKNVASFSIAVNNGKDKADFFECQAWDKTAEFVSSYLNKGTLVSVSGSIHQNEYKGSDGTTRRSFQVNAQRVNNLSPKGESTPKVTATEPAEGLDEYDPFADN